jgi:hypothetical protein
MPPKFSSKTFNILAFNGWLRQKEDGYAKNVIDMMSFTTNEFSAILA